MIKDKIQNSHCYYGLSDDFKLAFEWLKKEDLTALADGRYEINQNIYANIQTYNTKEEAPFEAHREYADIQYMISGKENIGVGNYNDCTVKESYEKTKDLEFLNCNKSTMETLEEGDFLVFFPQDAHQPSLNCDSTMKVKKVVVKIKL